MKFSINKNELVGALTIVSKGVSTRSTLPVLSGILLEAVGDKLILQTTDLELSIKYSIAALVEEEGKTVVPGKLFFDIIKSLPDAAVLVRVEDNQARISCDNSKFMIKTLSADDFPAFPEVTPTQTIEIPFPLFSSMVKKVARVVSKDESRAVLTGVLIGIEDDNLRMVATDSYRLAITDASLEKLPDEPFSAVIAGAFLSEIAALPSSDDEISIGLSENQIIVTYQDTVFINRRIEGNFPNYKQLLPNGYTTKATLDVDSLTAGVKRASLLGSTASPVRFDLNGASQTVQINANAADIGDVQETLKAEIEGEDIVIAFNYAYVLEGLASVRGDRVYLETQSPLKPGVFRAEEPENYLYLVMPIRVS